MNKLTLYRWTLRAIAPILRLYLKIRVRLGKEDPQRLCERFGRATMPRPAGRLVWIHAASVGESQSVLTLIERLFILYPNITVLITTGTKTSAEFIKPRLHSRLLHQYIPLDHPGWVDSFLHHWMPNFAIWVESELWPNLISQTKARNIDIVLLNARMSDESFESWQKNPGFIAQLLKNFSHVLAQNETYARYFTALGASPVEISGNLKFAAAPLPYRQADRHWLQQSIGSRLVWCAASTHEGEEKSIGEAHRVLRQKYPGLLTIIAPRHPQRSTKIQNELRILGLNVAVRSRGQAIAASTDIYLADTIGELGLFFSVCKIVFMGGSLKVKGGHNLLEPARYGCAIVYGPQMQNFVDLHQAMQSAQAAWVVNNDLELQSYVQRLLGDIYISQSLGQRALAVAQSQDRILDFVVARLQPYIGPVQQQDVRYANA
ncbi:MAG: 3-deoxy-D-manno-octulosonic acid transferase [Alphaproteobacteria bacterium]|nr:MAG: 3-deoxy-D-manno-octulosonic acid transferase [Alphaproteobacteria bacterium]